MGKRTRLPVRRPVQHLHWSLPSTSGTSFPAVDLIDILWKILATLALVALNGFFVAAEFAAVGARASRLELVADRSLMARLSLQIKHKLDLYLSTCQLG